METQETYRDEESQTLNKTSEKKCKLVGKVGKCTGFLLNSQGNPWFTLGPDWPFCTCLLLFFVCIDNFVIWALDIPSWLQTAGLIITLSFTSCFLSAVLINPGIQMPQEEEKKKFQNIEYAPNKNRRACTICGLYRQKGTVHCSDCELCVQGYDHHCPWTGKCIGRNNLICFYGFLLSIFSNFIYLLLVVSTVSAKIERNED